jgi:hypothetical protein
MQLHINNSSFESVHDALGVEVMEFPLPEFRPPPPKRIRLACPNVVWADGELYRCGTTIGHDDEREIVLCKPCQEVVQGLA